MFILFCSVFVNAQQVMNIKGYVVDFEKNMPVENVLILASKFSDSTLAGYTRSDNKGYFELHLPSDTFQISFHHTDFGEKFIFVLPDKQNRDFDFGNIKLPSKEYQLDEILIYADREPVYYKGDTLIYIADSFKVRPDATVEDLLKKLPGIQVDKSGKIKVQGKDVDKVLVDGDEFFGNDPTMATKNLQAKQVENVQVYEQKNQDNADNTDKETIQVMNIQLKNEAKKGYFGKIYGGSDAKKFYEGKGMFNYFKDKQKLSVFGLSGNTPNFDLDWSEMDKYGLENEMDYYFYDEDEDWGYYYGNSSQGIPKISKGGIYYANKWKKLKLNSNYSAYQNILNVTEREKSQYFLVDTMYYTNKNSDAKNQSDIHKFNIKADVTADSLNSFIIQSSATYQKNTNTYFESTDFSDKNNTLFRNTTIHNTFLSETIKTNNNLKYKRKFRKKDRELNMSYTLNYENISSDGKLFNSNTYYVTMPVLPSFDQKKTKATEIYFHKAFAEFTEPLSKYLNLIFSYNYQYSAGNSSWKTFNPNPQNDYVNLDSSFSNVFKPTYFQHLPSLGFRWNKSKVAVYASVRYRYFDIQNINLFNQQSIHYSVDNWLPLVRFSYKFNKTTFLSLSYNLRSSLPDLPKLQPVLNNNNPNNINIGNPYLLPTLEHAFRYLFYTYRPVTNQYFWFNADYSLIERDFSSSVNYDNTGRSITQAINTKNNYRANASLGATLNFFKNLLIVSTSYGYFNSKRQNLINNLLNYTQNQTHNFSVNPALNLEKEKFMWTFGVDFSYTYNIPKATLNNNTNQPYSNYYYSANTSLDILERFSFETDIGYQIFQNYANGYNPQPLVWNISAGAKVDKKKHLKLSFLINDILNQSVSIQREISTNVITDKQINIIRRYFLFQLTYNFNQSGQNEEEE